MTTYALGRPAGSGGAGADAPVPRLDPAQRAVVDHPGGPLLVLAGPGTGKTTTMVEAVVDRVERRGLRPDQVLALTFSRKAAEQLRDRVTARLRRTTGTPVAATFHSFAYSLVRAYADTDVYTAPLRLLTAAEQDVAIRELLEPSEVSVPWPEPLAQALRTRGFAGEVATLLARAREKDLDPRDLVETGLRDDRPEWVSAGRFLEQYLLVLDAQSALDYPDLVVRAVRLAERPEVQGRLRATYQCVLVDEYQDTDPAQVALLRALAGDGRDLVVVGDPDQSIYGFRGADVRGILDFPAQFPAADGSPAPVLALRSTRRFGARLLAASRRLAAAMPAPGSIPAEALRGFREPEAVQAPYGEGAVEVVTFDTARAETEHIADRLRRAHLEHGVPWGEMAVLVRSGRTSIPVLRRSLSAAGVPVETSADDTALPEEPAVAVLVDALRVALHLHDHAPDHPDYVDVQRAEALLLSPLGGMDAVDVRALARMLRARDREAAEAEGRPPVASPLLVRRAVIDPSFLDGLSGGPVRQARRLATLLARAGARLRAGATAEEVLWTLWDGTGWPQRLRRAATSGGSGALLAHRDLDAVVALFDAAARAEEQRAHTGVESFLRTLEAQRIPADTLADRGVSGERVRLLTAHRAKGLEWRLVVVAHVQEQAWPDLRRRSTLLRADELDPTGLLPALDVRALLAEERRLFYVACTRARERLLVTAVRSPDDDGEQPSRFLAELADPSSHGDLPHVQGRPLRPLSLGGLVAELRRTAADPASSPALREAAVRRLADLALLQEPPGPGGAPARALVAAADPATWWGVRPRSHAPIPVRDPESRLRISASALESLLDCPAKWFLEREAAGETQSTSAQGFGLVVHALADRVAKGEVAETDDLMGYVDRVWSQLAFRTPWTAAKERAEVQRALDRFLAWHRRPGARTVVATEQRLEAEVTIGTERIVLRGYADRLELDEDGHVVVVDFKTTKYPPPDRDLPTNPQLGLYQLAIDHGAADHLLDAGHRPGRSGGAELVQLRRSVRGEVKVQHQPPQQPGPSGFTPAEEQVAEVVGRLRAEQFHARPGDHCDHCGFHVMCPVKGTGTVLS
jgi:superfamily I DNA/RNA helicase/RecB family exonuclease